MNKKGQAAMEFLMTYGWAILVVIAAIAALAYFGVLDPARLLPERCQFPAGMDCIDKASITQATITLALRNNQGFPVTITAATATNGGAAVCVPANVRVAVGATGNLTAIGTGASVPNNEVFRVEMAGCGLTMGNKYDGDVTVSYTNQESGLANQAVGSVRGRIAA